ncbi:MAG TPA: TIGR04255 family protein, partial [Deltaproteobacteria bacterium]|nr:TIGR04255 family protein [Deltaproteobacteria bacterium]
PLGFDLKFSFPATKPKGSVHLRVLRGKREGRDALIWETHVQSVGDEVPEDKSRIRSWIDNAHTLTDDWFFKMIEGDLLRRFE